MVTMETKVERVEYALRYAAIGWPVFPCGADKRPLVARGLNEATCNAAQIKDWWRRWPRANIGVTTGAPMWVLDVDARSGGLEAFAALEAGHAPLITLAARTGGGGTHLFFAGDPRVRNSANRVAPGIDVRGTGGYVLVEPSVTDGAYQFLDWDLLSGELPALEPAPAWLLELVLRQQPQAKAGTVDTVGRRFGAGRRNDELARVAGALRRRGVSVEVMTATLLAINLEQCDPPLDEAEVRRIAKSIGRYEPADAEVVASTHASAERVTEQATTAGELGLELTDKGLVVPHELNVVAILERHPTWAGKIRYDCFHGRIYCDGREWSDSDDSRLMIWLQQAFSLRKISVDTVRRAVDVVARRHESDEPADWVRTLKWDGVERVPHFFQDKFGAMDSEYMRAVSLSFWLSMTARVLRPGCQVDTIVVLEGSQGIGKSSGLRAVGGPWYGELHESVASKDFSGAMQGKVLLEISELNSFSKAEVTRVKQVISCPVDRYRAPYGRRAEDVPRRSIMAATTNEDDYLSDSTGGRRFLPVRCHEVRVDRIEADREQCFAEAAERLERGEVWWDIPSAETEQEARLHEDPWADAIATYATGRDRIRMPELLDYLGVESGQQTMAAAKRAGKILRRMGWERRLVREGGKPCRFWMDETAARVASRY